MLWSYSRTLGSRIAGIVFFFGLGLLAVTWFVSSRAIRQLAEQQFREVSRRQVLATQAHLGTAPPALDTLDSALSDTLAGGSSERLARSFLGVLRANPGFTWVSYGDERGSFVGAYRVPGGGFRINRSAIENGKTELFEHDVLPDGTWKEFRHELDTGYDPRTRPFYTSAKNAGHRIWTRPYVFFEQGVPGITCAQPHLDADGKLAGVITIDFDLNALSGFVRSADLSEHGTVVLFTPDGTLLAHPAVNVVTRTGAGDQGTLLSVADLPGPPMRALHAELGRKHEAVEIEGGLKLQNFSVRVDGTPHLASFTAFPVDRDVLWFVGAIAPESDFLGQVQWQMIRLFIGLLVLVGLAVPVASYWLSERFARQLRALSGSMNEVGRLELADTPFLPTKVREIVAMQQALASMKGGLRSFALYVPRDLVKRLLQSGQEAKLGGETREMTVFFSDIEGFTTIAESMTPAELVLMLSTYLEEMTKIIAAHGGTVDKFLGDGILAFWGAPESDADHALHAAQAALECSSKLDEQVKAGAFGGRVLRARIGLASGPVLVGNIGTTERMNYTVMGDTANLASRLEALNKAYQTRLLVSEETVSRLKGAVLARPLDVVAVKGKVRGVKVYELLGKVTGKPSVDADNVWLSDVSKAALDDYLARDFVKAATAWERVLEVRPGDGAAAVMKARAEDFVRSPPPAEWTGVHVAKEK